MYKRQAQNNAVVVVEDFSFEAPKTKDLVVMTKNLKVSDKKLLVILPEANKNVYLSARNVKGANAVSYTHLLFRTFCNRCRSGAEDGRMRYP